MITQTSSTPTEPIQELTSATDDQRKPGELIFSIIMTAVGLLGFYFAMDMTSDSLSAPAVFPKGASALITTLGLINGVKIMKKRPATGSALGYLFPRDVAVMFFFLMVFCFLLGFIQNELASKSLVILDYAWGAGSGLAFSISSFAFMVAGILFLHRELPFKKRLAFALLIALGALVILIAVFRYVFLVILP